METWLTGVHGARKGLPMLRRRHASMSDGGWECLIPSRMFLLEHPAYLLILVFHACGLLLAFPALLHTRTPQGTIAWVICLIIFPYLAVPLYLILGPRRFEGYVKARRRKQSPDSPLRTVTNQIQERLEHCIATSPHAYRRELFTSLSRLVDFNPFEGNSCEILVDGMEFYNHMEKAVREAERYILVQFYIIKNDHVGKLFKDLLIERAREGLEVYVIYDEIGSHKLPLGYITELRKAGVRVEPFNGKRSFWLNIVRVNFRDHRKMVIADGRVCFIGGINVGMEYLGEGEMGYWRDTAVELRGPAVLQSQLVFLEDWNWATGERIKGLAWDVHAQPENKTVMTIPSGPADTIPVWRATVIALANTARHRLWIASPYFVPDAAVLASLQAAALRGVDLRIIFPSCTDNRLVKFSAMTYLPETIPYGIKLLCYTKGFLHQKVILVDDDLAAIGTANLDNRSLELNFEITALINDSETAAQTKEMLVIDMADCREMGMEEYLGKPLPYRMACNIARLMAPVL